MHKFEILRRPITNEKTDIMTESYNKYVFEVAKSANKRQIKEAVEAIFTVKVTNVHTLVVPGKSRRWGRHVTHTPSWKKAVVTLAAGNKIDLNG